ncbi:hypothetical protein TRFO_36770 [Tritrichomonas foetus]|uniref:Fungal lipase-type domain-containing protein n=1 Tax=Tritrichomonas foetus TaxID=1144522 RepID=A0A1J4JCZ3_9EUKA|nr:hypothetical protein TRFO_36770 [Tritrichomonas foetus]|eukprot:OHS97054.1 hypothetical protein TRFO_36770 [Tritrichomonas foetus]
MPKPCCSIDYEAPPFDLEISKKYYSNLFSNRDPKQFSISIDNKNYEFRQKISKKDGLNYIVKVQSSSIDNNIEDVEQDESDYNHSDNNYSHSHHSSSTQNSDNSDDIIVDKNEQENCELLRRIFLFETISINNDNYQFLNEVAQILELSELKEATSNFYYVKKSPKSFFLHVWTNIFGFISKLGLLGRVLTSFWDLTGPTMIICIFLNILILFVTMSLLTLKDYMAAFFCIVIPFLIYSLYFPNIVCISIIEALQRNIFKKKTFFYSHQKLVSAFIRIVLKKDNFPKYFNLGQYHDFIHGLLFLVFVCGFLAMVMNQFGSRFLDVWLQIFCFYIPIIRYVLLDLLYLIHSFSSLFDGPRKQYKELNDFDDPYLCTFYLRDRNWINLIFNKTGKRSTSVILKMIFSKTTFSFLAALAVIIYMICAETRMNSAQVCIMIFIFICGILVLSTRITFPFFWAKKIGFRKMTEGKLKEMRESLNRKNVEDKEIMKWHENATVWSRKYTYLRWSSIIMTILTVVFIVVLTAMGISSAIETSNQDSPSFDSANYSTNSEYSQNNTQENQTVIDKLRKNDEHHSHQHSSTTTSPSSTSYSSFDSGSMFRKNRKLMFDRQTLFRKSTSPTCFIQVKGIDLLEVIAISQLTNYNSYINGKYDLMIKHFLSKREFEFVDTPFIHDKSFLSAMSLIKIKDPKLSIFVIRGTVNTQDIIADAEIWFASVMINIIIPLVPFVEIYSDRTIELVGIVTNVPRYAFKQFSLVEEYKRRFLDYINNYISNKLEPDEDILITGHSLGGGLAKIISLETGIQAVANSGPGVRAIGAFYKNESLNNVKYSIIDIIPGEDLVARVDLPIGTQIDVPCRRGLICHDARRTMCQIAALCDEMDNYRGWCETLFDNETIAEMIRQGNPVNIR